jgi:CBS domain-containing protein
MKGFSEIRRNLRVADVMTRRVVCLEKNRTVYDAAKIMAEESISAVVVTENNKLAGILTERDLVKRVLFAGRSPKKTKLGAVMTKNPKKIGPAASILCASNYMKENKVRKLVVTQGDVISGIVSQTDIVASLNTIYRTYKSLLWNPWFFIFLFLFISALFLLNYILFWT